MHGCLQSLAFGHHFHHVPRDAYAYLAVIGWFNHMLVCAYFVLVVWTNTSSYRQRTGREALIFCRFVLVDGVLIRLP
jgi:hypothetical protein